MLCSQCGSSEPDSTTVCTSCGSSFDSAAFPPPAPAGFAALEDDTDTTVPETGGDNEPTLLGPSRPPVATPRRRPPPSPEITMAPATPPGRVAADSARRPAPGAGGSESVEGVDDPTQTGPLSVGQQFGRYTIIPGARAAWSGVSGVDEIESPCRAEWFGPRPSRRRRGCQLSSVSGTLLARRSTATWCG
jgi:hypothetical protein